MVSFIVPVYNMERYLQRCVESILQQTVDDWQLILIDDGSSDKSGELCARYASGDKRIEVVTQPNSGLSAARNAGLERAAGNFICFVDSDDFIAPDFLSTLLALGNATGCDIVASPLLRFSSEKDLRKYLSSGRKYTERVMTPEEGVAEALYQNRKDGLTPIDHSMSGKLYASSLWKGVRFRKGIYYEDLDIFYEVWLRANGIAFVSRPLYYYFVGRSDSIIASFNEKHADVLDVTLRLTEYMSRKSDFPLLQAAYDRELSANFNILARIHRSPVDYPHLRARCLDTIHQLRWISLLNKKVRRKNKLGILASLFGEKFLRLLSKF